MRPHGRFSVDPSAPLARGVCDRCNFWFQLRDLQWQWQWAGSRLQNLRILVCKSCLDRPQIQLKSIIIPADPLPVMNPRPGAILSSDNNVAPLGQNANAEDRLPGTPYGSGGYSNFLNANAAYDGNNNKSYRMCARVPVSANSTANRLGVRFSFDPSGVNTQLIQGAIPGQEFPQIYQTITGFKMIAPNNSAFLGSSYTSAYSLYGYYDSYDSGTVTITQTLVYSGTTSGAVGEEIEVTGLSAKYPGFKFFFTGDGVNALGVAQIELYASGPGTVTLGSSAY